MKQGYGVFGKPFEIMLRNDVHDPASIDCAFLREMILLDEESYPFLYGTVRRYDMTKHELFSFAQRFKGADEKETVQNVLDYTAGIAARYDVDFKDMLFGGTEAQILARGTDWCADMARVGCVLLQCLGIPCRMLELVNLKRAYNGHVACEAFYEGQYGVADFLYGYLFYDRRPLSAYDILRHPEILDPYPEFYRGLYSAIAVHEYDPTNPANNYTVSGPNAYTMKLICTDHNDQWIMGEDNA